MPYRIALSTINDPHEAENLARTLLGDRLVACVNIVGPLTSLYHWQDTIECDQEYLLIMKTIANQEAALLARVQELHPYEVPELIILPIVSGTPAYLHWLAVTLQEST